MRATFRTHLIFLYLVTLIIPREDYKSLGSSLCIFSPALFYFFLVRSKHFPQHPILEHPQPVSFP